MSLSTENRTPLAKLITLPDIFNGRRFVVPDYQRGYAWEGPQVQALLEDIEYLETYEHVHFTGTIVLNLVSKSKKNDLLFEIVDGQQRLTTLSMLISILTSKITDPTARNEFSQLFISRGVDGNKERVFSLNSHVDQYFNERVIEHRSECKGIELISENLISAAYQLIDKWVEAQNAKKIKPTYIIERICKYLGFIVYQPDDDKEVGMMFEIINNRGKPLTELEKVKNYLIYYAIKKNKKNLRKTVDVAWGEILKNLASAHHLKKPDEKTFLRSSVITYLGFRKEESQNIYDTLKKKFPINESGSAAWKKLECFVEFLRRTSVYYEALMNEESVYRKKELKNIHELVEQIELIRSQSSHAAILPIYFALMDKRKSIKKGELVDAFRMLECTNFRVYMTRNGAPRSDSGQGRVFDIAHQYYSNYENIEWLENKCKEEEIQYKTHTSLLIGELYDVVWEYIPIESFVDGLILKESDKYDFYTWVGIKYFLMNYEREINKKRTIKVENILKSREGRKTNDYFSIEHIWAKSNDVKGKRIKNTKDMFHKRRLGNFVLLELGINIQAADKDIEEKIEIYKGSNSDEENSTLKQINFLIKDFKKVKESVAGKRRTANYYVDINVRTIDRFEKRLVEFAKKRWSIAWAQKYWPDP